jgi:serine/threonine protein phosphatase PrpC/HAMP domain-containing protein
MSTHSFCSRQPWKAGRLSFSLLAGLFIALLLALAPFSRVSATSTQRLLDTPPIQQNVARAGASVVRLVASYTIAAGKAGQQPVVVQCTGLGILVASWQSLRGNDQNSWILTDGSLVNGSIIKNAGPVTCDNAAGSGQLSSLDLFLSAAYHPAEPAIHIDNTGLQSEVVCQNTTDCSKGAALFSFNYEFQLPYADLAPGTTASQGIDLTQSVSSDSTPPLVNPNQRQNPLYVQRTAGAYLTPHLVAANNPNIELGTPLVDTRGSLIGMHLMSVNDTLTTADIGPFMQKQSALQHIPQNLVHDNWNKGITSFYQHNYTLAHSAFQQIVATNAQFQGANDFARFALAQQNAARAAANNTSLGGFKFKNLFLPYWLLSIAALILLALLLLLTTLLFGRSYQHRRRFKQEIDEANRQATIEAQRIKEIEISQREAQRDALSQQPTLIPVEPTSTAFASAASRSGPLTLEQRCPRCNDPVAPGSRFCGNCRQPLTAEAEVHVGKRKSGLLAAFPAQSRSPIADQPTLDMSSSVSSANGMTDPDKTEPYLQHPQQHKYPGLMIVTRTDRGIKRQHKPNEDNLFAGQVVREIDAHLLQCALLVVADGMGGHANGQDASRIAIQAITDYILPQLITGSALSGEGYKQLLLDGVQRANQAVHQGNVDSHGDMGTTMTGALVVGTTAYVANVGDSRTYLYREGEGLSKITQDHSVVASLVSAGIIKPDDIYTHPKRNQIYRSLGERENVEVDPFVVQLLPDDKLLLCSDGLWDMVRDPLIENVIKQNASDLEKTADGLIQAAFDGGGEDNVSIIVAHFTEAAPFPAKPGFQLVYKPDSVQLPDF